MPSTICLVDGMETLDWKYERGGRCSRQDGPLPDRRPRHRLETSALLAVVLLASNVA